MATIKQNASIAMSNAITLPPYLIMGTHIVVNSHFSSLPLCPPPLLSFPTHPTQFVIGDLHITRDKEMLFSTPKSLIDI